MIGVDVAPGTFSSSSFIADSSSAMSLFVKGTPLAARKSLADLQVAQVGVEKTSTFFSLIAISLLVFPQSARERLPDLPRRSAQSER